MRLALLCLSAFTALGFLSILWAPVPAVALEGADRTLLYLLVFALFACWPQRGPSAALLLVTYVLAIVAVAAYAALHLGAATAADLQRLVPDGRLVYPASYANANAAQWLIACWPALLLARTRQLPWALRGVLAGGAVLLALVALLSQSRGSLYVTPLMLVLVFALVPGRTRTLAVLVPVAAGIGLAAPSVLRVGDHLRNGAVVPATLHSALAAAYAASAAVGVLVALGSLVESRRSLSPRVATRVHRGIGAAGLAGLVVLLVGALALTGNPVTHIRHAWDTFKSPAGYAADTSGSRLTSGLGSERYDVYRVALDAFTTHPVLGIGADNYAEQYLAHGRTQLTPRYPHSVELRTLSQSGIVGTLLAIIGLGAALLAGFGAMRGGDPLARSVAAAALAGFCYWLVHGSFDWFWEIAGLGAPAFAMLGLACALTPAKPGTGTASGVAPDPRPGRLSSRRGPAGASRSPPA